MDDVVYLDLLFQILQEYARIIGGKEDEASSRGSTMMVKNVLKNPWGRSPFYIPRDDITVGDRFSSAQCNDAR